MHPVAYIRRSVARTGDPGDVSRQFQTDKVRALANGDGATLRIVDGDWGISGSREKTPKRLAFASLMEDIARGEISTLYAFHTDRLARSVTAASLLLDACERAGVTIVTGNGRWAPGDSQARRTFQFDAMMNEAALDAMVEKSDATARKRRERGDKMGRAPYGWAHEMINGVSTLVPYTRCPDDCARNHVHRHHDEDPAHVIDVFSREGSYLAAAQALNAEGFATRFDRKWDPTAVRHVVKRTAPELIPVRTRRGAKTRSVRLFAGLLRCPHQERHPNTPFLTSEPTQWGIRYYCRVGHVDPTHPRPYMVNESRLVEWAKLESAKLAWKLDKVKSGQGPADQIAKLEARKLAVLQMFEDGDIDRDTKRERLAAIVAEMARLESARRITSFVIRGRVRWDGEPAEINAALRNLWQYVELGPDMVPIRAAWNIGMRPDEDEDGETDQ